MSANLPKTGEFWAGWGEGHPGNSNQPKRLEILAEINPGSLYRVRYRKRGEGMVEDQAPLCLLLEPWNDYKQRRQEDLQQQQYAKEMQSLLKEALWAAEVPFLSVFVYADGSPVDLRVSSRLLEALEAGLGAVSGESGEALGEVFGV